MNKIVYVEPGDMLEVRFCDPAFDMTRGKAAWEMSIRPERMLIELPDYKTVVVPFHVDTLVNIGARRKQRL